jgi:hypothetical protein
MRQERTRISALHKRARQPVWTWVSTVPLTRRGWTDKVVARGAFADGGKVQPAEQAPRRLFRKLE